MGPTIFLLTSKNTTERFGNIKNIQEKKASEKPFKYLSETSVFFLDFSALSKKIT